MKKILLVLVLGTLVFTGCGNDKKVEIAKPIISGETENVSSNQEIEKKDLTKEGALDDFEIEDYDEIVLSSLVDGYFTTKKGDKYGLISKDGKTLIECNFDEITTLGTSDVYKIRTDNKYGIWTSKKEGLRQIPLEYDEIIFLGWIKNQAAYITKKDGKYNIINESEETLFSIGTYDNVVESKKINGICFFIVKKGGKYALINQKGEKLIPFGMYDNLSFVRVDNIIAQKNGKIGLISENNDEILPFIYEELKYGNTDHLSDSIYLISKKDGKYGLIDDKNNILLPYEYDDIEYFRDALKDVITDSYYKVKKDGKWGLANQKNEILIDIKYDEIADIDSYSLACRVRNGNKWGIVYLNNFIQTVPCKYDIIEYADYPNTSDYVTEIRCKFSDNGGKTWGIISADDGRILLDCVYEEIKEDADLAEGTADDLVEYNIVKKNGKWGVLDKNNKIILDFEYDEIYSPGVEYNGGTFFCKKDGKWGIISPEGETLFGFKYSSLGELEIVVLNTKESL